MRQHAASRPDQTCYTLLHSLEDGATLSFAELDAAACTLAAQLRRRAAPGARVLLLLPTGAEFLQAFWACLYAGMIAVPLYPPKRNDRSSRIANIVADCTPALALIDDDLPDDLAAQVGLPQVVRVGELAGPATDPTPPALPGPDTIAFLQYSSGSTGNPKGVMLSYRNIAANLAVLQQQTGSCEHDVYVGWLPLHHDMGMVMTVIMPVYAGARAVIMAPARFARTPLLWLQVMARHGGTISGAPDFAYAVCAERFSAAAMEGVDLHRWRIALNGAEPIRPGTVERFIERYTPYGFAPGAFMLAYGMAEATVFLCASHGAPPRLRDFDQDALRDGRALAPDGDARVLRLASCGAPPPGHELIVVGRGAALPQGQVGEIWARGASIAGAYWNDASRAFGGCLADGSGPWLQTGDLGFVHEGELFVLGRQKDILIVQGRNLYPNDLEACVRAACPPGMAADAAVFGVAADGGEQVILALEVRPRVVDGAYQAQAAALRCAVFESFGVLLAEILFVAVGTLPKTTSGKIMRPALRASHGAGQLPRLYSSTLPFAASDFVPLETNTELALAAIWQELLGPADVHAQSSFIALGGDSLAVTRLADAIGRRWQLDLPLKVLFEHPTLAALAAHIDAAGVDVAHAVAVPARPAPDAAALTPGQLRLWLLSQMEGTAGDQENIAFSLDLEGALDVALLERALAAIVERHAPLRTRVIAGADGVPRLQPGPVTSPLLTCCAIDATPGAVAAFERQVVKHRFDLARDPLLRAALGSSGQERHVLVLCMHHIAADGWSAGVLAAELTALYGASAPLAPLATDFAAFAHAQRKSDHAAAGNYWKARLAGVPAVHNLPLDRPRRAGSRFRGATHASTLDQTMVRGLVALCAAEDATLFMGLHAAFAVVLARYSHDQTVVIGSPSANRGHAGSAGLIGCCFNLLALRADLDADPGFRALLAASRQGALAAYQHQAMPFEQVLELVQPPRAAGAAPLFQVMLALHNTAQPALELNGVAVREVRELESYANAELMLSVRPSARGLELRWKYDSALFDAATIAGLADNFAVLAAAIVASPDLPVSRLPLLSRSQRDYLQRTLNATATGTPPGTSVHARFEAQAAALPDAKALSWESASLGYAQLNARANRLAHHLRARGVAPDSLVGLCVERSPDMVVALLAILKTGAAYVPLDPGYPSARLAFMVADSGVSLLLTQRTLHEHVASLSQDAAVRLLMLDDPDVKTALDACPDSNPGLVVTAAQLAYVIYTSGSTGAPKGVMIEHGAVLNFLDAMATEPGIDASDAVLQLTSLSFDIAALELFLPLTRGARVVLAAPHAARQPGQLWDLIAAQGVSLVQATPSGWRMLLEHGWPHGLQTIKVLCGGEGLPAELARALLAHVPQLWNLYGPTETTIWSTCHRLTRAAPEPLIGRPIANTVLHVLDRHGAPVPFGVVGELHIGGAGLARGYWRRPGLTAERFVVQDSDGARLYRTGDLVRYTKGGVLACLGRADHQLKLRGVRIEPGEIEAALAALPGVRQAAVALHDAAGTAPALVAYVVPGAPDAQASALDMSLFFFGADTYAPDNKYQLYLDAARFADEQGFAAVWTPERHFDAVGSLYPNPALLNAALAMHTRRIALRAGSVVLPLHSPARVAEEWAVVDNLSSGRAGIAIASGWHPRDFVLAPERYQQRRRLTAEAIGMLRALWRGEAVELPDGDGKPVPVRTFPRPLQAQLPLWITAAGNPDTFVDAGRSGANLLTHLLGQTPAELTTQIARYRQARADAGLDPATGTVTVMVHSYVGDNAALAQEQARAPFLDYLRSHLGLMASLVRSLGGFAHEPTGAEQEAIIGAAYERYTRSAALIGSPESCLGLMEQLRDGGVDEVACLIDWMPPALAQAGLAPLARLRRLAGGAAPSAERIRRQLAAQLPPHLVPAHYVVLDALPCTPNGKLDRQALPAPAIVDQASSRVAPAGAAETLLAALWAELLQVPPERIGADANFFALGGHSLLAVRMAAEIKRRCGAALSLGAVFGAASLGALARLIDAVTDTTPELALVPLPPVAGERVALSFAQQRLWFLYALDRDSAHYNMPTALRVRGPFDQRAAGAALRRLIARHEPLRSVITSEGRQAWQVATDADRFELTLHDLRSLAPGERDAAVAALARADAERPFDLSRDLMLRASYLACGADDGVLLLNRHHIASDGWSTQILIREFVALYDALRHGAPDPLAPLALRYSDYARWQRAWLDGDALAPQLAYWERQLAGLPAVHGLHPDHERPPVQTYRGARHGVLLEPALRQALQALARHASATPFMVLHGALAVLLARYAGNPDVVVGTAVSNRPQPELEALIGMFANTLVLRVDTARSARFVDLLDQVKTVHRDAQANAAVPFEYLVERLKPARSMQYGPLFQIMFSTDPEVEAGTALLDAAGMTPLAREEVSSKYELSFSSVERDGGLELVLEYNVALFSAASAAALVDSWAALVRAVVADPQAPLAQLPVLDAARAARLMPAPRVLDPLPTYPDDLCLHQAFERRAATAPEREAISYDGRRLTYGELNARANRLAHLLRRRGVGPGVLVGLCAERGTDMLVGLLAILKAGGAYAPLDPDYPAARLAMMLADCRPALVLTEPALCALMPDDVPLLLLDDPAIGAAPDRDLPAADVGVRPDDLAYVIYTSGSTGVPKGVMVEHRQVMRLFAAGARHYAFRDDDAWTMFHSFAFDVSVWEIWGALLHGARLVIVPRRTMLSPRDMLQLLRCERVTILSQTPRAFAALSAVDTGSGGSELALRYVVFGGEVLNFATLAPWVAAHGDSAPQLINMYGITETTVHATFRRVLAGDLARTASVVGVPLPDLCAWVLTPERTPAPVGVTGELYIGGAGLARGYLNRPELTAERFIDNPFHDPRVPGSSPRLYRSGDLARHTHEGELEYLGRIDDQVKIRGFRIELGEVESRLNQHAEVRAAVVLARACGDGERRLLAWVAPGESAADPTRLGGRLKAWLAGHLPDYMIPAAIVVLAALPLTANGKVDKGALPDPQAAGCTPAARGPGTATEHALVEICADLLKLDHAAIGLEADFFELGGHSLLLMQFVWDIKARFGVDLGIKTVLGNANIGAIATMIDTLRSHASLAQALSAIPDAQLEHMEF